MGPGPEIPTSLLHYRVLSKLGEGGMGAVYKAEDTKLGRTVAIKVMATARGEEDSARQRLLREARAASGLSHPSIVTIFAVEHVEERDFIVMELVDGSPLDVLLSSGPLDMARVLALGADVAEALDCAHAAGIVHRDIKPANIVVTARGRAKVLDFGVAKSTAVFLGSATDATMPAPLTGRGVVVGTVPYMSPEQMRGEALDGRSDLFALGCVLYEAATGRRAFGAHEVMAIVHAVLNVDPPAPSSVVSSVPTAFDAVLRRALAKDRAHRFASAADFAAALRALATGTVPVVVDTSRSAAEAVLVGRGAEVARLASCFDRAAAGDGSLVLVTGDAGIGKSAVVEGLLRRAGSMERSPLVGRGTCVEQFGAGEAYLPVLGMLDGLLAGRDGALVRETLRAVAPTWALQLRGAHDSGDEALRREAATGAKDAMVRELGEFIATLAAAMPLLFVIEDVHWADPSTVSVLTYLAQRLRAQRALVVVTARAREIEEQGHPLRTPLLEWRAKRTVDEVALGELSLRDVTSWLNARFPGNRFAEGLAAAVHARTEGHPLYVASLVDYLVEQGRIRDEGGWQAESMTGSSLGFPESLLGMLRAKLEILADGDRELVALASVQGEEFSAVVLADAGGQRSDVDVDEQLTRIARAHRLTRRVAEVDLPDGTLDTRWRFAHALYRDVAYDSIPSKRRALIHRHVGESLLRHHGAQAERVASTLAVHFERARDFERAIAYHAQAGENALNVLANVEADAHFTAALSCADRLAEGAADRARSRLLRFRGLARNAMGRPDAAVEDLRAALVAARRSGDGSAQGKALTTLTRSLLYAHRVGDALPFARETVALGTQLGDEILRVEGHVYVANLQGAVGNVGEAMRTIESVGDGHPLAALPHAFLRYWRSEYARAEALLLSTRGLFVDAGFTLFREMFLGLVVGNLGRLSEARSILVTARDLAMKSGNVAFEARLENCIGWVLRELGDAASAAVHDARSEELARGIKESEPEAHAVVNLADDEMTTRTTSGLAPRFAHVEALAKSDDWMSWRYLLRLQASRARERLASGTPEQARVAIDSLYTTASRYEAGKYRAIAKELAARAALSMGDMGAATRAIAEARAILADRPVPVMAWRVEALAADIASRTGDLEAAAAARTAARAMVQRLAEDLTPEDRARFLASPTVREVAREA